MIHRGTLTALVLAWAGPALAGSVLAPSAPIIGDGASPATLQLFVADPIAKIKIKPSQGKVGLPTRVQGGFAIPYTAPAVTKATQVELKVSIRGAAREDFSAMVEVVPAWTGKYEITFDPPAVATDQTASVKVRPLSGTAQDDAKRNLWIKVSHGSVGRLVPTGDGTWIARYTPPEGLERPVQALVAVGDAAAPFESFASAPLPVTVEQSVTLDAPADSSNILTVGDREYGPNKATPTGKVAFDVALHPAHLEGRLVSVAADGTRTDTTAALPAKVEPSIVLGLAPAKAPGGATIPLPVFCVEPTGAPCVMDGMKVTTSGGTVAPLVSQGPGMGISAWTLPDEADSDPSLRASFREGTTNASVGVLAPHVSIALSSNPPSLTDATLDFTLTARVKDGKGTGMVGRMPEFIVEGARAIARPKDNKDGTYENKYRLDAKGVYAVATVSPDVTATGLPTRRIVLWPATNGVAADGGTVVTVLAVAEDALGMPVPDVSLSVAVPTGDGAVPPTAVTGKDGVARLKFKAGNQPGLSVITVSGAGFEAATGIWQATATAPMPEFVPVGSPSELAAIARWKETLPVLVVVKQAAAPVPATPVAAPPVAAPPVAAPPVAAPPIAPPVATPGVPVAPPTGVMPGTVPGTTPGLAPVKPPKAPRMDGAVRARVRGALVNAPFSYGSKVVSGESDAIAPEASFAVTPAFGNFGFEPRGEVWFDRDRKYGADARFRVSMYRLALGTEKKANVPIEFEANFRYRYYDAGIFGAWSSLGFARSSTVLLGYADETKSSAELSNKNLMGVRIGSAAVLEPTGGDFLARAEVSVTILPISAVILHGELAFDIPLPAPVDLHAAIGLDAQFRGMSVDDTVVAVAQIGQDFKLGVTVPFR